MKTSVTVALAQASKEDKSCPLEPEHLRLAIETTGWQSSALYTCE
jgi:hypothetical protein